MNGGMSQKALREILRSALLPSEIVFDQDEVSIEDHHRVATYGGKV